MNKNDKAQEPNSLQYLEFANTVSLVICRYLESSNVTKEKLQELVGKKTLVGDIARKLAHEYLQLVPDMIVDYKQQLAKYFQEIFDVKLNLSKIKFPQKDGLNAYMVVPPNLDEDTIMDAFVKKWGIKTYKYLSPVAEKIDRDKEQPRPSGLYVFAHKGGDEPDEIHRGKSYNQAKSEDMTFASTKEYLLITGFHKYTKKYFMDKKGWTRTSSLWSDGSLVYGNGGGADGLLYLCYGDPDDGDPDDGLRELVL